MDQHRMSICFPGTAALEAFYRDFGIDFSLPRSDRLLPLLSSQLLTYPTTGKQRTGLWTLATLKHRIAYVDYQRIDHDDRRGYPHFHINRWWFDPDQNAAALIRSFHVELNEVVLACPLDDCELPAPVRFRLQQLVDHATKRLIEGTMRPHAAREMIRKLAARILRSHRQLA